MTQILLNILAFSTLLSSILVITSKNPVIAVIFLISVFVNAAGYLILLGVGFIGISYIIVYVGAITVLFLFVIMMINIKLTDILETGSQYTKNLPLGLAIGTLFIYEMFTIVPFTFNNIDIMAVAIELFAYISLFLLNINNPSSISIVNTINPIMADVSITQFLHIEALGHGLYTYGASLLILCSLILLLAMTAPIFISKNKQY